jgi:hypothetical protein
VKDVKDVASIYMCMRIRAYAFPKVDSSHESPAFRWRKLKFAWRPKRPTVEPKVF